jgi:hypothetical protein
MTHAVSLREIIGRFVLSLVLVCWARPHGAHAVRHLGTAAVRGIARDVVVYDTLAYLLSDSGLTVIDIRDPATPNVLAATSSTGTGFELAVHGEYAYLSGSGTCIAIVDVSSPAHPELLRSAGDSCHFVWGIAHRVAAEGEEELLGVASNCGVDLFSMDHPDAPARLSRTNPSGYLGCSPTYSLPADSAYFPIYKWGYHKTDDVVFRGDQMFVLSYEGSWNGSYLRLTRLDIADPTMPVISDRLTLLYGGCALTVDDSFAYVAHRGGWRDETLAEEVTGGMDIIETVGEIMRVVGTVTYEGSGEDIALVDDTLYVAAGAGGVKVLDCGDKTQPRVVDSVTHVGETPLRANGIWRRDRHLFVADATAGLLVFDTDDGATGGKEFHRRAFHGRDGTMPTVIYSIRGRRLGGATRSGVGVVRNAGGWRCTMQPFSARRGD